MLARYEKNGRGAVSPQCVKVEEEEAVLSTNDVLLELSAGNLDPWEYNETLRAVVKKNKTENPSKDALPKTDDSTYPDKGT